MKAGDSVAIGTHVLLYGEHQGRRVPCTDESCEMVPHWEQPAGEGTRYEPNVTRSGPVFRYHREAERTAKDAVVVGYEGAATGTAQAQWEEVGTFVEDDDLTDPDLDEAKLEKRVKERSGRYAEEHDVPLRRRKDDRVYEALVVRKVPLPWAKPKLLVLTAPDGTLHSVDYEDVELAG